MAGPVEVAIEVRDTTVAYGDFVVMRDLNFDVRRGEVFVILGGSGCGKSSLLKHMIGLYRPAKGAIRIGGDDIATAEGEARRRILRRFGVMYQLGALFGSIDLLGNVCLPLEEFTDLPHRAREIVALSKLDLVGLREFAHHYPSEISGGMQKRAAIARALALDPGILFLDEPSAGLDPVTSAELDALILRLRDSLGTTFVIVTHELASIYAVADRVIMLDKRRKGIVATGTPADLRDNSTDPWVRAFFHRTSESGEDGP